MLFYSVVLCLGIRHLEFGETDTFSHIKLFIISIIAISIVSQDKTWAQSNLFTRVVHSS